MVSLTCDSISARQNAAPRISDAERDYHNGAIDVQRLCAEEACFLRDQGGRVHPRGTPKVYPSLLQPQTSTVAGRPISVTVFRLGNIDHAQTLETDGGQRISQTQELGECLPQMCFCSCKQLLILV